MSGTQAADKDNNIIDPRFSILMTRARTNTHIQTWVTSNTDVPPDVDWAAPITVHSISENGLRHGRRNVRSLQHGTQKRTTRFSRKPTSHIRLLVSFSLLNSEQILFLSYGDGVYLEIVNSINWSRNSQCRTNKEIAIRLEKYQVTWKAQDRLYTIENKHPAVV